MHRRHQPAFDLPPRLTATNERRLSEQALALWQGCRRAGPLPTAAELAVVWPRDGADCLVTLTIDSGGSVAVAAAGRRVAAAFGLSVGPLDADRSGGLAARLREAAALMTSTRAPTPFAARLTGATGADLLTRGVLLPLAGPGGLTGGAPGEAIAVVTWREALERRAQAALDAEVRAALTARFPKLAHTARPSV